MSPTVRDFFVRWSAGSVGLPVRPAWLSTRRALLRRVLDVCGDVGLCALAPEHLWSIQRRCLQDGVTASTANHTTHGALRAMLRDAEALGLVDGERVRSIYSRTRKLPVAPSSREPFTLGQRDRILDRLRIVKAWAVPFISWQFATGMRPGETLGLTWADIDVVRRWCQVTRTRAEKYVGPPKTRDSVRDIPLTRSAITAIAGLERTDGYVFVGPRGAPIGLSNFERTAWRPTMNHLNLRGRALYTCRHSFISWQIDAGRTPAEVARYCGTSVAIIQRHYYRFSRAMNADAWDAALGHEPVRRLDEWMTRKA